MCTKKDAMCEYYFHTSEHLGCTDLHEVTVFSVEILEFRKKARFPFFITFNSLGDFHVLCHTRGGNIRFIHDEEDISRLVGICVQRICELLTLGDCESGQPWFLAVVSSFVVRVGFAHPCLMLLPISLDFHRLLACWNFPDELNPRLVSCCHEPGGLIRKTSQNCARTHFHEHSVLLLISLELWKEVGCLCAFSIGELHVLFDAVFCNV